MGYYFARRVGMVSETEAGKKEGRVAYSNKRRALVCCRERDESRFRITTSEKGGENKVRG